MGWGWRSSTRDGGTALAGPPALDAAVACPHCDEAALWPADLGPDHEPLQVCTGCGQWVGVDGPRIVCDVCGGPADPLRPHGACRRLEPRFRSAPGLPEEIAVALHELYPPIVSRTVERYLPQVAGEVGASCPVVLTLDTQEPLVALLPGRWLAVSRGTLAALDDEAQLAFLIAREAALYRAGWVVRRFAAATLPAAGLLARWRKREPGQLARAVLLTARLGYGAVAEDAADTEALVALRRAEYDIDAAPHALRHLEPLTIETRGARFLRAAARAAALERVLAGVPHGSGTRLNREVYRRVVGELEPRH